MWSSSGTRIGKQPYFDRIVVKAIGNTAAMTASLLSGGIDYIAGELGSIDQAMAFEERAAYRFLFNYKPGLIYEHIDVDLDVPALQDRRVRRALMHAIDREAISQILFGGPPTRRTCANESRSCLLSWHTVKYQYDPQKAAALLEDAQVVRTEAARATSGTERRRRTSKIRFHDDGRQQDPRTHPTSPAKSLAKGGVLMSASETSRPVYILARRTKRKFSLCTHGFPRRRIFRARHCIRK